MAKNMAEIADGVVINVLWCSDHTNDTEHLIDQRERPVGIGDTYRDGKFYRGGVEILSPLEQAQKELSDAKAALKDAQAALSVIYSGEV